MQKLNYAKSEERKGSHIIDIRVKKVIMKTNVTQKNQVPNLV